MPDVLAWPPKKEDLSRLYLEEHLSAAKIAKVYGLAYASPKTAESTVLYHLKRCGIQRRDKADHVRKITDRMVDEWVLRYNQGESLKQIAGKELSPVTVWYHFRRRGFRLRKKVDAQIKGVTKHPKRPFSGDLEEKAYLLGLTWGDIHASRHGRAIRAKTATTHPSMVELLRSCLGKYAHVSVFPVYSPLAGYEWAVQADLDNSFEFLLEKYGEIPDWIFKTKEVLFSFIAGLFDAEGSVWLHETTSFDFELSITNSELDLLEALRKKLVDYGFDARIARNRDGNLWRIRMWNRHTVRTFLETIPFKHREKKAKADLALKIQDSQGKDYSESVEEWDHLRESIRSERDRFIEVARVSLLNRNTGGRTTG